jgi:hypothetical protein
MSVLRNSVRLQPGAASARLTRLLLLCRFDFRQKSWSLPVWAIGHDAGSIFHGASAALVSVIVKQLSDSSA